MQALADIIVHPQDDKLTHADVGTRKEAIAAKCLDCSADSGHEVRNCRFKDCALHKYRTGHGTRTLSEEQRAALVARTQAMNAAKKGSQ